MGSRSNRSSQIEQLDAALDGVHRAREQVMTQPSSVERSLRLAALADVEASWWEVLSEHSRTRVHWRAALVAREHALQAARRWRQRVTVQRAPEPVPQLAWFGEAERQLPAVPRTAGVLR